MKDSASFLVVDDHTLYREGLIRVLKSIPRVKYYEEAGNGKVAIEKLRSRHFDCVVLDISMPVMNGIVAARLIKEMFLKTHIIILSMFDNQNEIIELIEIGVDAYVLKTADREEILKAIELVSNDAKYFSPEIFRIWENSRYKNENSIKRTNLSFRELEVLVLLCQGYTTKQIAIKLYIEPTTVTTHRVHIMNKLGVKTFAELICYSIRNKLFIP